MYNRIFPTKFIKWGFIGLGGFTAAWWLCVVLVTIFQCTPIRAAWELAEQPSVNPNSKCIDNNGFFIGNGVPNIVTDLCILVLPLREVYNLHIRTSQKIALGGVFMLGALVIVSSIIKLHVTVKLFGDEHADYTCEAFSPYFISLPSLPYFYPLLAWHRILNTNVTMSKDDLKDFIIWTFIETGVGIISASLPPLRPLLTATLRTVGLSRDASKNPSGKSDRMTIGGGSGKKSAKSMGSTATTIVSSNEIGRGPFKQLHDDHDYELGHPTNQWPRVYRSGEHTAIVGYGHATVDGRDLPLESVGTK